MDIAFITPLGISGDAETELINFAVNTFFLVVSLLMFFGMTWVGFKVYKIVKFNDWIVLSMIFFLTLVTLSEVFFYAVNLYEDSNVKPEDQTKQPIAIAAVILPIMTLVIAIGINLRNWVCYYIKIGEMAFHS